MRRSFSWRGRFRFSEFDFGEMGTNNKTTKMTTIPAGTLLQEKVSINCCSVIHTSTSPRTTSEDVRLTSRSTILDAGSTRLLETHICNNFGGINVRQLTYCVIAPPMTGPMQTLMPMALTTIPWKAGTFSKGTTYPIMARAPWRSPAAPTPRSARPKMSTLDEGLAAETAEPTIGEVRPHFPKKSTDV